MVTNFAHRGAIGYFRENTMLAFEKAVGMYSDRINTRFGKAKNNPNWHYWCNSWLFNCSFSPLNNSNKNYIFDIWIFFGH